MARAEALLDRILLIPFPRTVLRRPVRGLQVSRKHIGHMRYGLAGNPNDVTALISDTDEYHCALAIAAAHSAIVAVLLGLPSLKSTVSGSVPVNATRFSIRSRVTSAAAQ